MSADDFSTRIATAYASTGRALSLGRGVVAATVHPDAVVQIPASMLCRHGLIAGATGTGKTKTLQLMAEQLSDIGVPVFAADVKGDLSGVVRAGDPSDKIAQRSKELGIEWKGEPKPAVFFSLGGNGPGVPLRATVSSFGPTLMAKVLEANDTQESSLSLVFHYADQQGLALLDLADLRAVLQYLTSDDGRADLKELGGLSSATAGVLLRAIIELETQGGESFFGEPEVNVADLMRTTPDGKGLINCLELSAVQDKPKLFSTFLMWVLAELFHTLPEVGDLDQPKLVFFLDEAHLLFEGASKAFLTEVAQTVRLIRSKGVGVFFVTQLPDDVPEDVLSQLGNRVQHALRAFTPRDAKALKAAVTTYPKSDDYDLENDLTQLGIGEAMVTILSERGAPTPVVWTRMQSPVTLMAAIATTDIDAAAKADALWATYGQEIDRESAREKLTAKMDALAAPAAPAPAPAATAASTAPPAEAPAEHPRRKRHQDADEGGVGDAVVGYLKSREGRSMVNSVGRGLLGLLKR